MKDKLEQQLAAMRGSLRTDSAPLKTGVLDEKIRNRIYWPLCNMYLVQVDGELVQHIVTHLKRSRP